MLLQQLKQLLQKLQLTSATDLNQFMKEYDALNQMYNLPLLEETCRQIIEMNEEGKLRNRKLLQNLDKIKIIS